MQNMCILHFMQRKRFGWFFSGQSVDQQFYIENYKSLEDEDDF